MIDYNEPSDDQSKNCVFCCPGSSIPTVGGGNDKKYNFWDLRPFRNLSEIYTKRRKDKNTPSTTKTP